MPSTKPDYTFKQVVQEFIRMTKRYDLVTSGDITTAADNGAYHYVNMGQRWLDNNVDHPKMYRRWKGTLASGALKIEVDGLIAVVSLALIDSDSRTDLTEDYMDYEEFRSETGYLLTGFSTGTPTGWTITNSGLAPELLESTTTTLDSASITDYGDIHVTGSASGSYDWGHDYILFDHIADTTYNVDILGTFYSPFISDSSKKTYWTVEHPHLLALAGAMMLEMSNRNSQGINDYLTSIQLLTTEIDNVNVQRTLQVRPMEIEG